MDKDIRLTAQGLKMLKLFIEKPQENLSGAEISRATRIRSGTLYPLLARFESAGWLTSEWEAIDPKEEGRPRRRLYKLTALGQSAALEKMQEYQIGGLGALAWN